MSDALFAEKIREELSSLVIIEIKRGVTKTNQTLTVVFAMSDRLGTYAVTHRTSFETVVKARAAGLILTSNLFNLKTIALISRLFQHFDIRSPSRIHWNFSGVTLGVVFNFHDKG